MSKNISFKASRITAFLLAVIILLCAAPSSALAEAPKFSYKDEQDAWMKALDCLMTCAFSVEYNSDDSTLKRWEKTIKIYVSGSPTSEDRKQLDIFISDIAAYCPNMPDIRLASSEANANIVIWYGPLQNMSQHVDGYNTGNWGYFSYLTYGGKISSARIAIASDVNSVESKKHLLLEELMGAFGLTNDHNDYSDSILYAPWTTVGSLSKVDWLMLNMLYDPALKCGMGANEAYNILKDKFTPADVAANGNSSSGEAKHTEISAGRYSITTALDSRKVLEVDGFSTANDANIQIYDNDFIDFQKFDVSKDSGGYIFKNCGSSLVMDVQNAVAASGTNVMQYQSNSGKNQRWAILDAGGGYYYIKSNLGDFYLEVAGSSTANRTNVRIASFTGNNNQKWKFTSVN